MRREVSVHMMKWNFRIKISSLLKVSNTIRGRFELLAIFCSCNTQMVRVNVERSKTKRMKTRGKRTDLLEHKKVGSELKMNGKRVTNISWSVCHIPLKMNSSRFALIIRRKLPTKKVNYFLYSFKRENSPICAWYASVRSSRTLKRVNFIKSHYMSDIPNTIIIFLCLFANYNLWDHPHTSLCA